MPLVNYVCEWERRFREGRNSWVHEIGGIDMAKLQKILCIVMIAVFLVCLYLYVAIMFSYESTPLRPRPLCIRQSHRCSCSCLALVLLLLLLFLHTRAKRKSLHGSGQGERQMIHSNDALITVDHLLWRHVHQK